MDWHDPDAVFAYYRSLIAGGSDYVGYSEPTLKRVVLGTVTRLPGQRVTELGCGPNPVVPIALARQGRHVTAVELSTDFVETARLNAGRQNARLELVNAPAHDTGLPDGCADVVILTEVLEHVPDEYEDATLREAYRLLDGGGRLVISVPNAGSWFHRYLAWRTGVAPEQQEEHLREYTPKTLHAKLRAAGFVPERGLRVPATDQPPWRTKAAWLIDRVAILPRWSLKAALVAVKPVGRAAPEG